MRIKQLLISGLRIALVVNFYEIVVAKNCDKNDGGPIFVHTVCRHGNRNSEPYANDPYKSVKKYWPEGYNQLTNLGKLEEYNLGKYLRRRYKKLTRDGRYNVNRVYVQSSDDDTVLASAEACLAGLFPPHGKPRDQIWNKHLGHRWQPIPVHTAPENDDILIEAKKPCKRYDEIYDPIEKSILDGFRQENPDLFQFLEANSGENLTTLTDVEKLQEVLIIEKSKGLCLPKWAQEVYGSSVFNTIALNRFPAFTATTELKKLKSGFLLKDILDRFTEKHENTLSPNRSLWMYFGHKTTLINLLNTLGLYEPLTKPPHASCILFELYQCAGMPYVQIYFKNTTKSPRFLFPENIPNCGSICPLQKLYEVYDDVLPKRSFDEECDN